MHLTEEQRRTATAGKAAKVVDPDNKVEYVLIRADAYERMLRLLEVEEFDPSFFEVEEEEIFDEN